LIIDSFTQASHGLPIRTASNRISVFMRAMVCVYSWASRKNGAIAIFHILNGLRPLLVFNLCSRYYQEKDGLVWRFGYYEMYISARFATWDKNGCRI